MPFEGPGKRTAATATKACNHGDPVVEVNVPGIAAKSQQVAPLVPSVANAAIAQQIAIGEQFVIMSSGLHEIVVAKLPAGYAVGSQLFIRPADNSLHLAGATIAGDVKLGVITDIDVTQGRAHVNLDLRGSF